MFAPELLWKEFEMLPAALREHHAIAEDILRVAFDNFPYWEKVSLIAQQKVRLITASTLWPESWGKVNLDLVFSELTNLLHAVQLGLDVHWPLRQIEELLRPNPWFSMLKNNLSS